MSSFSLLNLWHVWKAQNAFKFDLMAFSFIVVFYRVVSKLSSQIKEGCRLLSKLGG